MQKQADGLLTVQAVELAKEALQWYRNIFDIVWIVTPSGKFVLDEIPEDRPFHLDSLALCGRAALHEGVGWVWARTREGFAFSDCSCEVLVVKSIIHGEGTIAIVPFVRREGMVTFVHQYTYDIQPAEVRTIPLERPRCPCSNRCNRPPITGSS